MYVLLHDRRSRGFILIIGLYSTWGATDTMRENPSGRKFSETGPYTLVPIISLRLFFKSTAVLGKILFFLSWLLRMRRTDLPSAWANGLEVIVHTARTTSPLFTPSLPGLDSITEATNTVPAPLSYLEYGVLPFFKIMMHLSFFAPELSMTRRIVRGWIMVAKYSLSRANE